MDEPVAPGPAFRAMSPSLGSVSPWHANRRAPLPNERPARHRATTLLSLADAAALRPMSSAPPASGTPPGVAAPGPRFVVVESHAFRPEDGRPVPPAEEWEEMGA